MHANIETLGPHPDHQGSEDGEFDVSASTSSGRVSTTEVTLVAILDADKEGFARERALIQTIGRAARNVRPVIMYADRETDSMRVALGETDGGVRSREPTTSATTSSRAP